MSFLDVAMLNFDIMSELNYPMPFVFSPLLPLLLTSLAVQKHSPKTASFVLEEYDYVIVGGGSAGSVLAGRLSEAPCVRVLLLEAGRPPPRVTEIPAISRSFVGSDIDWKYRTAPQKHTGAGLVDRRVAWPSGKTLGGSSVLNAMFAIRGNRKNYDDWAAAGAVGWGYDDILPYFLKLEDNQNPESVANGFHGVGGPQTIHKPAHESEIKEKLAQAAKELGYEFVDVNGPSQTGFYDHESTLRGGQRCSTAKSYLVPAENRANLDILPEAMVRKVLFENNVATGVQFDFSGKTYKVRSRREVILSAGAVNSAQLLMLSGIGPREELQKFNIPVLADLPVGRNLQDHPGVPMSFTLGEDIAPVAIKLNQSDNIKQYIANRTGPLASTEGCALIALLSNQGPNPDVDFPDHELYFLESSPLVAKTQFGIKPKFYEQIIGPYEERALYFCISQILNPKSRGEVRLQSADPYDPPIIDPRYFEDPQDMEDAVQGMKTCLKMGTSGPMLELGSQPFQTVYPLCDPYIDDEDEYLRCMARTIIITLNHQVGTAKMGDPRDPTTVVDPQLRVKKVERLRVVDASVMPIIPTGNTNLPTIMVAEKAADLIKATIDCQQSNLQQSAGGSRKSPSCRRRQGQDRDFPRFKTHSNRRRFPTYPQGNSKGSAWWMDVRRQGQWGRHRLAATAPGFPNFHQDSQFPVSNRPSPKSWNQGVFRPTSFDKPSTWNRPAWAYVRRNSSVWNPTQQVSIDGDQEVNLDRKGLCQMLVDYMESPAGLRAKDIPFANRLHSMFCL